LQNNAQSRSYISAYTINSANTWEQKIIYIPGETTGTWSTDNSTGVRIWFGIGLGTSWDTTAGVWQPTNSYSVSGSVDFSANAGATFAITGVQLEQNFQPTPFEQRPIGAELALCQRYYNRTADGTAQAVTANIIYTFTYPVTMRRVPDYSAIVAPVAASAISTTGFFASHPNTTQFGYILNAEL
jgi:hypothetical protein